jgi:crotonobetainyl-CoA:carnitine CoA-transferase CaiB-like acyl-CoA transferase
MAGPFRDVRVIEVSQGQAARMAGMLLADLGADVLRADGGAGGSSPRGSTGERAAAITPEDLAWDRGKSFIDADQVAELAATADVVLSDQPWDKGSGLCAKAGLVRVWMPPHTPSGPYAALPDDPVLRSALGGFATYHPSLRDRPVASVVPVYRAVHGALGAAAAAAGLLRARTRGAAGDTVVVSGLHAMAACLATMAITGLDAGEVYSTGTRIPGAPNFRTYRAADGRWLQLAALSPELFVRALDVLDRVDVMLLPGIDGEFTNLLVPRTGAQAGDELEKTFAARPRDEWLARLRAAGIPAAPIATRDEWLAGTYHDGLITLDHPAVGAVTMPGVPIRLSRTPGEVRPFHTKRLRPTPAPQKPISPISPLSQPAAAPLAGLRVADLSTFLAAPFVSSLLADFGAEVVKVERPSGDPYRVFTASYAVANQAKSIGTLDLRDPAGREALLSIVAGADVLVDNMLASGMERLGLGDAELAAASPALVRCSVSAFGSSGAHGDLPGFDPVLQSLSGLAAAQGGDGPPVTTSAPVHDIATGVLGALGVLAALYERAGSQAGQHVTASLAASAGFLQLAEMTRFSGRPPAATGEPDYPGPEPVRRMYRAADGWIAIAATTVEQASALLTVTGSADPSGLAGPDGLAAVLAEAFASRPASYWLDILGEYGVPACPVIERAKALWDPRLDADFTHVIRDPRIGRLRLARGYADWAAGPAGDPPATAWRQRATALLAARGTRYEPYRLA